MVKRGRHGLCWHYGEQGGRGKVRMCSCVAGDKVQEGKQGEGRVRHCKFTAT